MADNDNPRDPPGTRPHGMKKLRRPEHQRLIPGRREKPNSFSGLAVSGSTGPAPSRPLPINAASEFASKKLNNTNAAGLIQMS